MDLFEGRTSARKMNSAIYTGWIRHRRFSPVENAFRYAVSMAYIDLDELDMVFSKRAFWSAREFNLAWFRRDDYMIESSRPGQSLADAVRELVQRRVDSRPTGPIRILTNVRRFGFAMNPVNFYYCFESDGITLHSIVAEINNTPWNEQFAYVLPCNPHSSQQTSVGAPIDPPRQPWIETIVARNESIYRFRFRKSFHVSPFMNMDFDYNWRFCNPDERLSVHMRNVKAGALHFDSTLILKRRPIDSSALVLDLLQYPWMTLKVFAAIYFQAAKLWIKRCPVSTHPKKFDLEKPAP